MRWMVHSATGHRKKNNFSQWESLAEVADDVVEKLSKELYDAALEGGSEAELVLILRRLGDLGLIVKTTSEELPLLLLPSILEKGSGSEGRL